LSKGAALFGFIAEPRNEAIDEQEWMRRSGRE
jgi:hypothetical protein